MESEEADTAVAGSRAWGRAGVQVASGQKALFSVHFCLWTSPCSGLQVSDTGREQPGEDTQDGAVHHIAAPHWHSFSHLSPSLPMVTGLVKGP